MLYRANSPQRDGLGAAWGCLAERLPVWCFLTSAALYCSASCEHGLWNSRMYRDLSKSLSIVGKYISFKTVHADQGKTEKFMESCKTSAAVPSACRGIIFFSLHLLTEFWVIFSSLLVE